MHSSKKWTRCWRTAQWRSFTIRCLFSTAVYSWWRMLQRGWGPVIDLSPLNTYVALSKFRMGMVTLVLVSIWKGDFMFSTSLKEKYFQIPIHPRSTNIPLLCSKQKDQPVQSFALPIFNTQGLQQSVCSSHGVSTSEQHSSALISRWLASHCDLSVPSTGAPSSTPATMPRPHECHQLGEVRSWTYLKGSISWNADGYHPSDDISQGLLLQEILGV